MITKTTTLSDWKDGGAGRDRTDDLIVANDALSQLSYSPTRVGGEKILSFVADSQLLRGFAKLSFTVSLRAQRIAKQCEHHRME